MLGILAEEWRTSGMDSQPTQSTQSTQPFQPVVPPEITAEVTQILSNLVLGDNQLRTKQVILTI